MSERQLRLGIDVKGTSTDAVVMSRYQVVASAGRLTTSDVREGVINAIAAVAVKGIDRGDGRGNGTFAALCFAFSLRLWRTDAAIDAVLPPNTRGIE